MIVYDVLQKAKNIYQLTVPFQQLLTSKWNSGYLNLWLSLFPQSKVQWTKEFMAKVRKSNEKAAAAVAKKKETKTISEKSMQIKKGTCSNLQEVSDREDHICGDGFDTVVEHEISDEELDYDDDLELEDDAIGLVSSDESAHFEEKVDLRDKDKPSSSQGKGNEKCDNQYLQELSSKSEEELMNNPVIQRMMENFFPE